MLTAHTRLPRPVYPRSAELDGRRVAIGHTAYAVLRAVLEAGGCVSVDAAREIAFGDEPARRHRLAVVVSRLNGKLAELGCPIVLALDGNEVVVV